MGASHLSGPLYVGGVSVNPPMTGSAFYVDSNLGSNSRTGLTPAEARATLTSALTLCTANKGDVVYLMPGHNENIGNAQINLNVAGVNVIGLGRGAYRPRFDFDHANASINIAANSCRLSNVTLLPSATDVLIGIDIETTVTDTLLEDIEALPGEDGAGVDDFALGIDLKVGCSRTVIRRYKQRQHASGAGYLAGIRLTGASNDVIIDHPDIVLVGAGGVAPINGITTLSTNVHINRGRLVSDDEPGIELLTGTTGVIQDTDIFSDLGTIAAATVADGMAHFRVRYVEVGNESDAIVKTASVND
jgi:hypothetical protein